MPSINANYNTLLKPVGAMENHDHVYTARLVSMQFIEMVNKGYHP